MTSHDVSVPERKRRRDRSYYYEHREEILEYQRVWRERNKEKVRSYAKMKRSISETRALRIMERCRVELHDMVSRIRDADIATGVYDVVCRMEDVCKKIKDKNERMAQNTNNLKPNKT